MGTNLVTTVKSKEVSDDLKEHKVTRQLWFYFVGSMFTQISTNAAQVIGPLVLLSVSSSGFMTLIFGLSAGTDALGTLFGSTILKLFSPNITLVIIQIWRLICNLLLVLLLHFNLLNRTNGALLILADNFSLGMYDTVRALLPLVWTDNTDNKNNSIHQQLKRLNQRAQFMFELGTLLGPLFVGIILLVTNGNQEAAIWCTVLAFCATCLCYMFVPDKISPVPESKQTFKETIYQVIHSNDSIIKQCYLTMILLQIYRVKSSLPAVIANSILHSPSSTAWITSMWGVSGMIGAIAFRNLKPNSLVTTLKYDALALLIFAFGWKTYNLYAYLMTVILYITIDSIVRLQVQTSLQAEITINSMDASIMSSNRFLCKINALFIRLVISACFYAPDIHELRFWLTTIFFILCSIVIYGLAYWFHKNQKLKAIINAPISKCLLDTTSHTYPGYLFVFEGLDGSGKSTQIMLLMKWLEEQYPNKKINLTTWNSSILLSNTIRHFKQQRLLKNPHSFALLQCTDLMERLNTLIIPALKNGEIVLCDRYCFTALARDKVRGCDFNWETQLYKFELKDGNNNKPILVWPDAILLFRVPVHIAIARVYARSLITIDPKRRTQTPEDEEEGLDSENESDLDDNQSDNEDEEEEEEEEEDYFPQEERRSTVDTDDPLFRRRIITTFRGSVSYDTIADDLLRDRSFSHIDTQHSKQHSFRHNTISSGDILSPDQNQHYETETSDYPINNYPTHNQSRGIAVYNKKTDNNDSVATPIIQISYYEAGLDLNLHSDFNVNFHQFQHKVQSIYEELFEQYSFTNNFHLFNGELDRETLFELIKQCIQTTIKRRNEERKLISPYFENNDIEKQILTEEETQALMISEQFGPAISINDNTSILQPPTTLPGQNNDKLFRFYKKSIGATTIGSTSGAALHFYSRFLTLQLQQRFVTIWESLTNQSISNSNQIKSYLHGNPQLDNCVITAGHDNGCFLLDFDRSRIGPISWDIIRLLLSVQIAFNTKPAILNEKENDSNPINYDKDDEKSENLLILPVTTAIRVKTKQSATATKANIVPLAWSKAFQQGYRNGIDAKQHLRTLSYTLKKLINHKKNRHKIPNYLKSSRAEPIFFDEIQNEKSPSYYILQLLQQYLNSVPAQQAGLTSDLNRLSILEIGRTYSTQHRERIIFVIKYANKLYDLEFKLMLHDIDANGFTHPESIDVFDDAKRFLLASELYLPKESIHQLLYPTTCNGPKSLTYLAFIHQIQSIGKSGNAKNNSTFKLRIGVAPRDLDSLQIQELLFSLGHQLGHAHTKFINSNQNQSQQNIRLSTYIERNWARMVECVLQLQSEVTESYQIFVKQQQYDLKKNL
ncbi:unnamed protein product [Rotaria sordida]|uniref:dTMP kinase n=1 Tax=Rotaria sordida TaxID=392033 RepID=A0A815K350_9BILA|nr:unnamed protein product [Rotaria sordida]CAF1390184.1 unnamed protein product [Rotaria sordida]